MTHEEFIKYRFTIKTEMKFRGEWYRIREIDFELEKIGIEPGYYLDISEYEGIRESDV